MCCNLRDKYESRGTYLMGEDLPAQSDLCGHDPLSLDDELAVGAFAVLPSAELFVPLQAGDHAVIATTSTFWRSQKAFHVASD